MYNKSFFSSLLSIVLTAFTLFATEQTPKTFDTTIDNWIDEVIKKDFPDNDTFKKKYFECQKFEYNMFKKFIELDGEMKLEKEKSQKKKLLILAETKKKIQDEEAPINDEEDDGREYNLLQERLVDVFTASTELNKDFFVDRRGFYIQTLILHFTANKKVNELFSHLYPEGGSKNIDTILNEITKDSLKIEPKSRISPLLEQNGELAKLTFLLYKEAKLSKTLEDELSASEIKKLHTTVKKDLSAFMQKEITVAEVFAKNDLEKLRFLAVIYALSYGTKLKDFLTKLEQAPTPSDDSSSGDDHETFTLPTWGKGLTVTGVFGIIIVAAITLWRKKNTNKEEE
ncbi:MAG: hypothetical protein AAF335_03210 [Bacteroidota bacterium]